MLKQLIKDKLTWVALSISAVLGLLITFSYLGAFLSPTSNTRNLPLAVVNLDQGISLSGQNLNYGQQIVERLTGSQNDLTYKWSVLESREQTLTELNRTRFYVALVIPSGYSASLLGLATQVVTAPVQLELLTNSAAGSFADGQARAVAQAVVSNISKTTSAELVQRLSAAGLKVSPQAATVLGDPVQAKIVPAMPTGPNSARGLSPFYFALMLVLSGFFGTNPLNIIVDSYTEKRRKLGRKLTLLDMGAKVDSYIEKRHDQSTPKLSALSIFFTKAVVYAIMAVVVGLLDTWMATTVLGMDSPNGLGLSLFAVFSVLAVAELTLLFQTIFGYHLSLVVGVFFFTILGVPASGGAYSLEMVPEFYRFLHGWLPMSHITEGLRALLFMNGDLEAGLGLALWVLGLYTGLSLLVGGLLSFWLSWRSRKTPANKLIQLTSDGAAQPETADSVTA